MGNWIERYTTERERLMVTVFLTGFSIPFLVGMFRTSYAVASGFVVLVAGAYLTYRVVIYRSIKFAHKRYTEHST